MSSPEFTFGMTLAGGAATTHVFADVMRCVLAHVGLKGEAGQQLLDQVMNERRKAKDTACTLHFKAHAGEIEIALSQDGASFRTTCPVPVR